MLCVSDYDWDYLITIGSEYQVVDDYKDVVGECKCRCSWEAYKEDK